jgi:hypothetical protein
MISAIRRDRELFLFVIHFAVFIVGVAVAAAINHWRSPDTLWWPWVLIGWGAAVATHGFALLLRKAHRRERIFIDPKARAFAVPPLCLSRHGPDPLLRQSHDDIGALVVLLGCVGLGRRRRLPGLVRVLETSAQESEVSCTASRKRNATGHPHAAKDSHAVQDAHAVEDQS